MMRKRTKAWLITATVLVLFGLSLFAAAMMAHGWDFMKLNTAQYETNTYVLDETFDRISIKTDTADIVFVPSEDGKNKVVCYEPINEKHTVSAEDGMLTVLTVDAREWYEYIGITFDTPRITVYLSGKAYASLSIEESTGDVEIAQDFSFDTVDIATSTGDICVKNVSAKALNLCVSTGDVTVSKVACEGDVSVSVSTGRAELTDVTCKNVISSGSTGELTLTNVIAAEKFSIARDTGDVHLDRADAAEISITTDTGDVTGSLLTDKVFVAQTDTGSIDLPDTTTGGRCEIVTDTGDIKIRIHS